MAARRVKSLVIVGLCLTSLASVVSAKPPPLLRSSEATLTKLCLDFDRPDRDLVQLCEQALGEFDHSNRQMAELYLNLGRAFDSLSQPKQARDAFAKASKMQPLSAAPWRLTGWTYWTEDRFNEAEAAFRKSLALKNTANALSGLASSVRRTLNDDQLALKLIDRAQMIEPNSPWIGVERGYILSDLGRDLAAVQEFTAVLDRDPEDVNAAYGLSLAENALDNIDQAIAAINTAVLYGGDDPEYLIVRSFLHRRNDSGRRALKDARRAQLLDPQNPDAVVAIARSLLLLGRDVEVIDTYEQALLKGVKGRLLYYNYADFLSDEKRWEMALKHINAAVAYSSADADDYNLQAFILLNMNQDDSALEAANHALDLEPKNAAGFLNVAYAQVKLGDDDAAMTAVLSAFDNDLSETGIGDYIAYLFDQGKYIFAALVRIEINKKTALLR